MMVERHFAWFRRDGGWLAEWSGRVPAPDIPVEAIGDARLAFLNQWQQSVIARLSDYHTIDEAIDAEAWQACPAGGAVCLDVTRFGWPVGDHVWHRWDETGRMLDWGPEHTFIEVRMDTLTIVGNQRSHRPISDAVPGQRVYDITGSPMAEHFGSIWGQFVWAGDRWALAPTKATTEREQPLVAEQVRRALESARIDLDLVPQERERVVA